MLIYEWCAIQLPYINKYIHTLLSVSHSDYIPRTLTRTEG